MLRGLLDAHTPLPLLTLTTRGVGCARTYAAPERADPAQGALLGSVHGHVRPHVNAPAAAARLPGRALAGGPRAGGRVQERLPRSNAKHASSPASLLTTAPTSSLSARIGSPNSTISAQM